METAAIVSGTVTGVPPLTTLISILTELPSDGYAMALLGTLYSLPIITDLYSVLHVC
jgi:hypothetical protein